MPSNGAVDGSSSLPGESLDEAFGQFRAQAIALARRLLLDDGLAEDVVQEVFLTVWRAPGAFDSARGGFGSWLMALVHHKAVDAVRREQSQRRRSEAMSLAVGDRATTVPQDVADEACDRAGGQRVRAALARLPEPQREALVLAYFGGYTQQQIATLTGTPLGTVKTRVRAGMHTLRRSLAAAVPSSLASPSLPSVTRVPVPRSSLLGMAPVPA